RFAAAVDGAPGHPGGAAGLGGVPPGHLLCPAGRLCAYGSAHRDGGHRHLGAVGAGHQRRFDQAPGACGGAGFGCAAHDAGGRGHGGRGAHAGRGDGRWADGGGAAGRAGFGDGAGEDLMAMLTVKNLTKRFYVGGGSTKVAVDNVSLTVETGQFVTVIGSNGACKSTLLNLIAGRHLSDEGRIVLDGVDMTDWSEHRRAAYIGRVFQDALQGTAASMTIEENLSMAAARGRRRGLRRGVTAEQRQRFRELLAQLELGLEDRLRSDVGLLSGGQRQSLSLIMATLTKPSLLLLDEHTAALDPKTARQVLELTERIVSQHRLTTLMVT